MERKDIRNLAVFAAGLIVSALSAALSTKAVLGTSPISAIPFVLSLASSFSFGTITFIFNMVFVVLGIIVMGRSYKPIFLLTVPIVIVFSWMCDIFTYGLFASVNVTDYAVQWILVILSSILLALGICLQLASNILMLPVDFFVNFLNIRWGVDYGKTKIALDVTLILIAAAISFICFGKLEGVREGTIFAAIAVGFLVRRISAYLMKSGFYEYVGHRTIDYTIDKK